MCGGGAGGSSFFIGGVEEGFSFKKIYCPSHTRPFGEYEKRGNKIRDSLSFVARIFCQIEGREPRKKPFKRRVVRYAFSCLVWDI